MKIYKKVVFSTTFYHFYKPIIKFITFFFYGSCQVYKLFYQFVLEGFVPSLYSSLGVFIPLIVVNCIILGRAESYASKNPVIPSIFDGIGMGLGFTVGLTSIGIVRELIGAGTVFGFQIMPSSYEPVTIFILAPGAFFVLSCLVAVQNKVKANAAKKGKTVKETSGCGDCASCGNASACGGKVFPTGNEE